MSNVDEVRAMQVDGKSEGEIKNSLSKKGMSDSEIEDIMSQAEIKGAVSGEDGGGKYGALGEDYPQTEGSYKPGRAIRDEPEKGSMEYPPQGEEYNGMQPSMLQQEQQPVEEYSAVSVSGYPGVAGGYAQEGGYGYGGETYQPYQESMSSDVITEISEQVVSEKLSLLRDSLEKTMSFKNSAESKMDSLDERLKRIERVLEKLELAILQRVGEYVNDVKDVKKEMQETQKSFKAMHQGHRHGKKRKGHP